MADNIENLLRDLALADGGLHRHEHPETGAVVIFPSVEVFPSGSKKARATEDQWEARAGKMHQEQEALTLAPKPLENSLAERLIRSD